MGRKRGVITYGELSRQLNKRAGKKVVPERGRGLGRAVSSLLHPLCRRSYALFGVLPGSIVVSKRTGMPSEGYFKFLETLGFEVKEKGALWRELRETFYRFCEVNDGNNWVFSALSDPHTVCLPPPIKEGKSFKGNGSRG